MCIHSKAIPILSVLLLSGTLCHSMEDILSLIMDNSQSANHEVTDLLLNCVEIINRLLLESEAGSNGTRIEEITEKIETFKMGNYGRPETHDKAAKITHTEYQRLQIENSLKTASMFLMWRLYSIRVVEKKCRCAYGSTKA